MVGGLFVWWFQLNGGMGGLGVRAHNLGKPNRLGACMIDSKGNVRLEGMFNRAHLAPEAQRAYDTLLECVLNGQKDCEVSARAGMDTVKALVELMCCDCPELIHLLGGVHYCRHGEKVLLVPNYAKGYKQSVTRLYTNLAKMERAAAPILSAAPAGASVFDRVLAIHDAYLARYRFQNGRSYSHSADGPLLKHRAVCEGWAKGFKYLLDRAGIDCVYAWGRRLASDPTGHAWCVVNLGERGRPAWYIIDPTRDGRDGMLPMHSAFGMSEASYDYATERSSGQWVPVAPRDLGFYGLTGRFVATVDDAVSIARGAGFPQRGIEIQLPKFPDERSFDAAHSAVCDRLTSTFACGVECCIDRSRRVIRIDALKARQKLGAVS